MGGGGLSAAYSRSLPIGRSDYVHYFLDVHANNVHIKVVEGERGAVQYAESKRRANIEKHGIDLKDAERFDWDTVVFIKTDFIDHEQRETVIGFVDGELRALVYVELDDDWRAISLRRPTNHEIRTWDREH